MAVIGASTAPGKLGHDILANLKNGGFAGPLYPINPKADEILGLKVYKSIADTPTPPELAVVVIPAKIVAPTLEQCAEKGVKAAIVITGGFAETGPDGERLQDEMAQVIRRPAFRVIGPQLPGRQHAPPPHVRLLAADHHPGQNRLRLPERHRGRRLPGPGRGRTAWASAASSPWATGWTWTRPRCIQYFNQDPHTQVIALYLEGVKRATYFLDALREATKPLVILKAGRTIQGSRAAESHTKSMAGVDAIYEALFRKYRVHRADTLEELFDFAKALAYLPRPRAGSLMITTCSGGRGHSGHRRGGKERPGGPGAQPQS